MTQVINSKEFSFEFTLCEVGPVEIIAEVTVLYGLRYGAKVWDLVSITVDGQEVPDRLWPELLRGYRDLPDTDAAHAWLDDEVCFRIADYL